MINQETGRNPVGEHESPGKPFDISKREVWQAYLKVAANKGAAGVDMVVVEEFGSDLGNNLYKIWNRLSSGSYFPPPVRAVEIPKPHGGGLVCSVCPRSLTGWPRRWWPCILGSGRNLGSTATPMATGRASRPWRRCGCADSGAGRTAGR